MNRPSYLPVYLFGLLLLIPLTRKMIVKSIIKKESDIKNKSQDYIEGEVVEKEKDKENDL